MIVLTQQTRPKALILLVKMERRRRECKEIGENVLSNMLGIDGRVAKLAKRRERRERDTWIDYLRSEQVDRIYYAYKILGFGGENLLLKYQ